MKTKTCPNCGANVEGTKCRYCGAVDDEPIVVKPDVPIFVTVAMEGKRYTFWMLPSRFSINWDRTILYSGIGREFPISLANGCDVDLSGNLIPFEMESLPGRQAYYIVEDI